MDQARVFFSLRWKILAWFFVNLAVLGAGLFLFLCVQFRVGIGSLLAGPTSDRLETVARPLVKELRELPENDWAAALAGAAAGWRARGLRVSLFHDDGTYAAGDVRELPEEVRQILVQHDARNHGMVPPPPGNRHGGPPEPPPDDGGLPPPDGRDGRPMHEPRENPGRRSAPPVSRVGPGPGPMPAAATGPLEKFMLSAGAPRLYWAGVHLGEVRRPPWDGGPPSVTLLLASESLRGGGLFFDDVPWLALGGGLVGISVLLWLPFVHGLTRSLARMTEVAEHLAHGRFDPPHVSRRRDELGRLGRALGHLAARLEGFVSGQKQQAADKVTVEVPAGLRACAAPDLLERAVANVVRNAVRYAGEAGPRRVSAAEADGGDTVTLRVTDEGPGVPPGDLDRLFDPFFRPETARTREGGGVGLGLAIVKSCVEACGGQVGVNNRSPQGLELTMTLLRAD